jgi:hypothetical protein
VGGADALRCGSVNCSCRRKFLVPILAGVWSGGVVSFAEGFQSND